MFVKIIGENYQLMLKKNQNNEETPKSYTWDEITNEFESLMPTYSKCKILMSKRWQHPKNSNLWYRIVLVEWDDDLIYCKYSTNDQYKDKDNKIFIGYSHWFVELDDAIKDFIRREH